MVRPYTYRLQACLFCSSLWCWSFSLLIGMVLAHEFLQLCSVPLWLEYSSFIRSFSWWTFQSILQPSLTAPAHTHSLFVCLASVSNFISPLEALFGQSQCIYQVWGGEWASTSMRVGYLCRLFGILYGRFTIPCLCIQYLFLSLWAMDMYFMLWVIIPVLYSFATRIVWALATGSSSRLAPLPLASHPFEHFLTFWHHELFQAALVWPLLQRWNLPFLWGSPIPFAEEWCQRPRSGAGCVCCY